LPVYKKFGKGSRNSPPETYSLLTAKIRPRFHELIQGQRQIGVQGAKPVVAISDSLGPSFVTSPLVAQEEPFGGRFQSPMDSVYGQDQPLRSGRRPVNLASSDDSFSGAGFANNMVSDTFLPEYVQKPSSQERVVNQMNHGFPTIPEGTSYENRIDNERFVYG
jgi:hypothetical protein